MTIKNEVGAKGNPMKKQKRQYLSLYNLLDRPAILVTIDGKRIEGIVRFITQYEVFVELVKETQKKELVACFKHALKYIRFQQEESL